MIISIHLLRFIAAMCVSWLHISFALQNDWMFGGFGVDIFFIISGFLMMVVSENNFNFKNFMLARIVRIVPLYWTLTILIALISILVPNILRTVYWDLQWFIESLFFFPGYRSEIGFRPILKLGWTLNYEIYFYLIFAISCMISHKFRAHIVSLVLLIVTLSSYSNDNSTNIIAFYGDAIVLNFILGMLLYQIKIYNFNLKLITSITLIIILFVFMFYVEQLKLAQEFPTVIIYGIPSCIILSLLLSINSKIEEMRKSFYRVIYFLGEISYAIYLTHIYVIACVTRILPIPSIPTVVIILLVLIVAAITHVYFDRPIQKMFNQSRKVRKS